MRKTPSAQSGQIALAVLLIMMVVLVVSLAVASRTTKDIAQTTQTTEAARVFSAAESGAEEQLNSVIVSLQNGIVPGDVIPTPASDDGVQVYTTVEGSSVLTQELAQGETAQVELDSSNWDKDIEITWAGDIPDDKQASLIVAQYYEEGGLMKTQYSLWAACRTYRSDGFSPCSSGSAGDQSVRTLRVLSGAKFIRIQSVYYGTELKVEGKTTTLPAQQFKIRAEAVSVSSDIQENSALEVTATRLLPPPFLDYVLYSGGAIQKP